MDRVSTALGRIIAGLRIYDRQYIYLERIRVLNYVNVVNVEKRILHVGRGGTPRYLPALKPIQQSCIRLGFYALGNLVVINLRHPSREIRGS